MLILHYSVSILVSISNSWFHFVMFYVVPTEVLMQEMLVQEHKNKTIYTKIYEVLM